MMRSEETSMSTAYLNAVEGGTQDHCVLCGLMPIFSSVIKPLAMPCLPVMGVS
jgi:hypothetical protein